MAIQRTRKNKENPNYNFLVSWQPKVSYVNRESKISLNERNSNLSNSKKAAELAKEGAQARIKKDLVKSLFAVSFILALELVLYFVRGRFGIN